MSLEVCQTCGAFVDTDYFPEIYRKELDDEPMCDRCYEQRDEEE